MVELNRSQRLGISVAGGLAFGYGAYHSKTKSVESALQTWTNCTLQTRKATYHNYVQVHQMRGVWTVVAFVAGLYATTFVILPFLEGYFNKPNDAWGPEPTPLKLKTPTKKLKD